MMNYFTTDLTACCSFPISRSTRQRYQSPCHAKCVARSVEIGVTDIQFRTLATAHKTPRHKCRGVPGVKRQLPCRSTEGRISVARLRPGTRRVMAGKRRRVKLASNPPALRWHQSRVSAIPVSDAFPSIPCLNSLSLRAACRLRFISPPTTTTSHYH